MQAKGVGHVLVVVVEGLDLDVVFERVFEGLEAFDVELDVAKGFGARGFIVNVDAFDVGFVLAFNDLVDEAVNGSALE